MTVPYLPFTELPEEIQLEIVERLSPEAHAKASALSKGLKRITDVTKCKKKAAYYKSKNKDPVREVVRDNDIECFQYFLNSNYPVYWGAVVEMVYLKRNEMLRLYDFQVRNEYRIALLLRILIDTNNLEGYEILKPRIPADQKFPVRLFKTESNAGLITRIKQDMPNIVYRTAPKPFEKISESIKLANTAQLQDLGNLATLEAITQDDIDAIKMLREMGYFRYDSAWTKFPIEKDMIEYFSRVGVDLEEIFLPMVISGNIYSAENILDIGFKPSNDTINYILEAFRDSAASRDLPPDDVLDWLLSRHIISRDEYDELLREFA